MNKSFEDLLISKIDLEEALRDLKFIDQCVLLFIFWEDEQLDKVASRLGMSITSVWEHEQQAIENLRKKLGGT